MAKKKKTKSKTKKKTTRRSLAKFPNLDPKFTVKSRLEFLDYDYLDKLSEKELEFLDKFSSEYIHSSFDPNPKKNLHTKEQELQIYNDDYARKTDILGMKKTRKMLDYVGDRELERIEVNMEDILINLVDRKNH